MSNQFLYKRKEENISEKIKKQKYNIREKTDYDENLEILNNLHVNNVQISEDIKRIIRNNLEIIGKKNIILIIISLLLNEEYLKNSRDLPIIILRNKFSYFYNILKGEGNKINEKDFEMKLTIQLELYLKYCKEKLIY